MVPVGRRGGWALPAWGRAPPLALMDSVFTLIFTVLVRPRCKPFDAGLVWPAHLERV